MRKRSSEFVQDSSGCADNAERRQTSDLSAWSSPHTPSQLLENLKVYALSTVASQRSRRLRERPAVSHDDDDDENSSPDRSISPRAKRARPAPREYFPVQLKPQKHKLSTGARRGKHLAVRQAKFDVVSSVSSSVGQPDDTSVTTTKTKTLQRRDEDVDASGVPSITLLKRYMLRHGHDCVSASEETQPAIHILPISIKRKDHLSNESSELNWISSADVSGQFRRLPTSILRSKIVTQRGDQENDDEVISKRSASCKQVASTSFKQTSGRHSDVFSFASPTQFYMSREKVRTPRREEVDLNIHELVSQQDKSSFVLQPAVTEPKEEPNLTRSRELISKTFLATSPYDCHARLTNELYDTSFYGHDLSPTQIIPPELISHKSPVEMYTRVDRQPSKPKYFADKHDNSLVKIVRPKNLGKNRDSSVERSQTPVTGGHHFKHSGTSLSLPKPSRQPAVSRPICSAARRESLLGYPQSICEMQICTDCDMHQSTEEDRRKCSSRKTDTHKAERVCNSRRRAKLEHDSRHDLHSLQPQVQGHTLINQRRDNSDSAQQAQVDSRSPKQVDRHGIGATDRPSIFTRNKVLTKRRDIKDFLFGSSSSTSASRPASAYQHDLYPFVPSQSPTKNERSNHRSLVSQNKNPLQSDTSYRFHSGASDVLQPIVKIREEKGKTSDVVHFDTSPTLHEMHASPKHNDTREVLSSVHPVLTPNRTKLRRKNNLTGQRSEMDLRLSELSSERPASVFGEQSLTMAHRENLNYKKSKENRNHSQSSSFISSTKRASTNTNIDDEPPAQFQIRSPTRKLNRMARGKFYGVQNEILDVQTSKHESQQTARVLDASSIIFLHKKHLKQTHEKQGDFLLLPRTADTTSVRRPRNAHSDLQYTLDYRQSPPPSSARKCRVKSKKIVLVEFDLRSSELPSEHQVIRVFGVPLSDTVTKKKLRRKEKQNVDVSSFSDCYSTRRQKRVDISANGEFSFEVSHPQTETKNVEAKVKKKPVDKHEHNLWTLRYPTQNAGLSSMTSVNLIKTSAFKQSSQEGELQDIGSVKPSTISPTNRVRPQSSIGRDTSQAMRLSLTSAATRMDHLKHSELENEQNWLPSEHEFHQPESRSEGLSIGLLRNKNKSQRIRYLAKHISHEPPSGLRDKYLNILEIPAVHTEKVYNKSELDALEAGQYENDKSQDVYSDISIIKSSSPHEISRVTPHRKLKRDVKSLSLQSQAAPETFLTSDSSLQGSPMSNISKFSVSTRKPRRHQRPKKLALAGTSPRLTTSPTRDLPYSPERESHGYGHTSQISREPAKISPKRSVIWERMNVAGKTKRSLMRMTPNTSEDRPGETEIYTQLSPRKGSLLWKFAEGQIKREKSNFLHEDIWSTHENTSEKPMKRRDETRRHTSVIVFPYRIAEKPRRAIQQGFKKSIFGLASMVTDGVLTYTGSATSSDNIDKGFNSRYPRTQQEIPSTSRSLPSQCGHIPTYQTSFKQEGFISSPYPAAETISRSAMLLTRKRYGMKKVKEGLAEKSTRTLPEDVRDIQQKFRKVHRKTKHKKLHLKQNGDDTSHGMEWYPSEKWYVIRSNKEKSSPEKVMERRIAGILMEKTDFGRNNGVSVDAEYKYDRRHIQSEGVDDRQLSVRESREQPTSTSRTVHDYVNVPKRFHKRSLSGRIPLQSTPPQMLKSCSTLKSPRIYQQREFFSPSLCDRESSTSDNLTVLKQKSSIKRTAKRAVDKEAKRLQKHISDDSSFESDIPTVKRRHSRRMPWDIEPYVEHTADEYIRKGRVRSRSLASSPWKGKMWTKTSSSETSLRHSPERRSSRRSKRVMTRHERDAIREEWSSQDQYTNIGSRTIPYELHPTKLSKSSRTLGRVKQARISPVLIMKRSGLASTPRHCLPISMRERLSAPQSHGKDRRGRVISSPSREPPCIVDMNSAPIERNDDSDNQRSFRQKTRRKASGHVDRRSHYTQNRNHNQQLPWKFDSDTEDLTDNDFESPRAYREKAKRAHAKLGSKTRLMYPKEYGYLPQPHRIQEKSLRKLEHETNARYRAGDHKGELGSSPSNTTYESLYTSEDSTSLLRQKSPSSVSFINTPRRYSGEWKRTPQQRLRVCVQARRSLGSGLRQQHHLFNEKKLFKHIRESSLPRSSNVTAVHMGSRPMYVGHIPTVRRHVASREMEFYTSVHTRDSRSARTYIRSSGRHFVERRRKDVENMLYPERQSRYYSGRKPCRATNKLSEFCDDILERQTKESEYSLPRNGHSSDLFLESKSKYRRSRTSSRRSLKLKSQKRWDPKELYRITPRQRDSILTRDRPFLSQIEYPPHPEIYISPIFTSRTPQTDTNRSKLKQSTIEALGNCVRPQQRKDKTTNTDSRIIEGEQSNAQGNAQEGDTTKNKISSDGHETPPTGTKNRDLDATEGLCSKDDMPESSHDLSRLNWDPKSSKTQLRKLSTDSESLDVKEEKEISTVYASENPTQETPESKDHRNVIHESLEGKIVRESMSRSESTASQLESYTMVRDTPSSSRKTSLKSTEQDTKVSETAKKRPRKPMHMNHPETDTPKDVNQPEYREPPENHEKEKPMRREPPVSANAQNLQSRERLAKQGNQKRPKEKSARRELPVSTGTAHPQSHGRVEKQGNQNRPKEKETTRESPKSTEPKAGAKDATKGPQSKSSRVQSDNTQKKNAGQGASASATESTKATIGKPARLHPDQVPQKTAGTKPTSEANKKKQQPPKSKQQKRPNALQTDDLKVFQTSRISLNMTTSPTDKAGESKPFNAIAPIVSYEYKQRVKRTKKETVPKIPLRETIDTKSVRHALPRALVREDWTSGDAESSLPSQAKISSTIAKRSARATFHAPTAPKRRISLPGELRNLPQRGEVVTPPFAEHYSEILAAVEKERGTGSSTPVVSPNTALHTNGNVTDDEMSTGGAKWDVGRTTSAKKKGDRSVSIAVPDENNASEIDLSPKQSKVVKIAVRWSSIDGISATSRRIHSHRVEGKLSRASLANISTCPMSSIWSPPNLSVQQFSRLSSDKGTSSLTRSQAGNCSSWLELQAPSEREIAVTDLTNDTSSLAEKRSVAISRIDGDLGKKSPRVLDDYDPYEWRQRDPHIPDRQAFAHVLRALLGSGVLLMPFGFARAGLVMGVIVVVSLAVVCTICQHSMIRSEFKMCVEQNRPWLGFPSVVALSLKKGPCFMRVSATFFSIVALVFLMSYEMFLGYFYVVLIAENIHYVLNAYWVDMNLRMCTACALILVLPLNYIPNLKFLFPVSIVGNIFIFAGIVIILYYELIGIVPVAGDRSLVGSVWTMPLIFGPALFAIQAVPIILSIENNMRHPSHLLGACRMLNITMLIVVTLTVSVGLFGYVKYGDDVKEFVTHEFPNETVATVCRGLFALGLVLSHPLILYPVYEYIWETYLKKPLSQASYSETCIGILVLRTTLVLITFIPAFAIPGIERYSTLFSVLTVPVISMILPALVESCLLWETHGFGVGYWKLWKYVFIILFGVYIAGFGTLSGILFVLHDSGND